MGAREGRDPSAILNCNLGNKNQFGEIAMRQRTGWTNEVSVLAACFAAAIGVLTVPAFGQWTQWGGPNQDFKSSTKGLASNWPEEGPKKIWNRPLGEGYSAIVVDDDRLYTMYREGEQEIVVALNPSSGETVWETKYDCKPAEGHVHEFGDGPRSTPLVLGDKLYTIGVSGLMHCLTKSDGKVVWVHDLWEEFKGNKLNHGYSSSPMAYKDTIITLVGGEDASIVAFDKSDGKVVWKKHSFKNSYSTPKLIKVDGQDQIVTFMANEIIGVDPKDGDLKWRYAHENQWGQNICLPNWDAKSGMLFFSNTDAGARGLKLTRKGDKTEFEEVWSSKKIQFYHVTSVAIGDYVYGSTGARDPSFFAAVNIKDGKVAWRERGFAKATTVLADGKLIILDEDGQLGLASATPEKFTVHSKVPLLDKVSWTVPTVVGKKMYVRDKKNIMALDLG